MNKQKKKYGRYVLLIIVLLLLLLVISFLILKAFGKKALLEKETAAAENTMTENEEVYAEDDGEVLVYQGEKYRYNENLTCILCMGVDKEKLEKESAGSGGQADMLVLAILDVKEGSVQLWNISRDAMTEVDVYNVDGEYVRTDELQACLAFAYGDGKHTSCENTVRAVSRLLYGMPIQSYAVLDLDAIRPLNDAVGGVEVTIHEEDILPESFVPGTTVLLKGDDVEAYVRSRRTEMPDEPIDSNNNRMARQKQYMLKFVQQALTMTKEDLTVPLKLYRIAAEDDHMVTNLNASKITYLTSIFYKVHFGEEDFKTVPGEVVEGAEYAEFHVDDDALYKMILDTFYIKQ